MASIPPSRYASWATAMSRKISFCIKSNVDLVELQLLGELLGTEVGDVADRAGYPRQVAARLGEPLDHVEHRPGVAEVGHPGDEARPDHRGHAGPPELVRVREVQRGVVVVDGVHRLLVGGESLRRIPQRRVDVPPWPSPPRCTGRAIHRCRARPSTARRPHRSPRRCRRAGWRRRRCAAPPRARPTSPRRRPRRRTGRRAAPWSASPATPPSPSDRTTRTIRGRRRRTR